MIEPKFQWLKTYVDHVVEGSTLPIDVVRELKEVGARISIVEKRSPALEPIKGRCDAVTLIGKEGYRVELRRSSDAPQFLTRRERFSLAHEWAHIIIDRHTGWRPVSTRQYYERESLCNLLASRMLVPERTKRRVSLDHPLEAVRSVARLRSMCAVSWPVSAMRATDGVKDIVIAELRQTNRRNGAPVLKVTWVAGSHELFDISVGKFFERPHPWIDLQHRLQLTRRIWAATKVGSERWALVASRSDPKRFFAWAHYLKNDDQAPSLWDKADNSA